MKRFLMMMVAVMALFTLSGCGESKDSYVKDFTKFVEKVQAGADKYSKADWEEAEKKYIEFAETKYDKYSSELSTDEMIGITKLKATSDNPDKAWHHRQHIEGRKQCFGRFDQIAYNSF